MLEGDPGVTFCSCGGEACLPVLCGPEQIGSTYWRPAANQLPA